MTVSEEEQAPPAAPVAGEGEEGGASEPAETAAEAAIPDYTLQLALETTSLDLARPIVTSLENIAGSGQVEFSQTSAGEDTESISITVVFDGRVLQSRRFVVAEPLSNAANEGDITVTGGAEAIEVVDSGEGVVSEDELADFDG